MEHNRRRWSRIPRELQVQVHFDTLDSAATAMTLDISRGGLFIATHEPRPAGTRVRCAITVADPPRVLDVEGVVVRSQNGRSPLARPGMGVELRHAPPDWESFCDELGAGEA